MIQIFIILVLLLSAPISFAKISVGPLRVEFGDGMMKPKNIIIQNTGNTVAFVKIDLMLVTNSNKPNRSEALLEKPKKYGLIILPNKLILRPKQKKNVRVMLSGALPKKDRIFIANIYEVAGEKSSSQEGISVRITYGTSIILHAKGGKPDIVATRNDKTIILHNKGTTSAKIVSLQQCNDKGECKDPGILYQSIPGDRTTYTLPFNRRLQYQVRYLGNVTTQASN